MNTNKDLEQFINKRKNRSTLEAFLIGLVVVIVTVLCSISLYHLGILNIWLRYFISISIGYILILFLVPVWINYLINSVRSKVEDGSLVERKEKNYFDFINSIDVLDFDSIGLFLIFLLLASVLVIISIFLPAVIVEVFAVESIMYYVLRKADKFEIVPLFTITLKKNILDLWFSF